MGKKSHSHKQRATFLVELEALSDDELDALVAIPADDPRVPAIYQEIQRRLPRRMQAVIDGLSQSMPREDAEQLVQLATNDETFRQYLDDKPENREAFNALVVGNEEVFGQVVASINEHHASFN